MKNNNFPIPEHIAIIMDGNRRWAKKRNLPPYAGHQKGVEVLEKICSSCLKKGIKILTVFAFSTENWNREEAEINFLMNLAKIVFTGKFTKKANRLGIRIKFIGNIKELPSDLQDLIKKTELLTEKNNKIILNVALNYGGKADICQAVNSILEKNKNCCKITEQMISENLHTKDFPEPELIIRTGGDQRLSNFLLWQGAYSELIFMKGYWPEFTEDDLDKALADYANRQRRFGK